MSGPVTRLVVSRRERRTMTWGVGAVASILLLARGVPGARRWERDALGRSVDARQRVAVATRGLTDLEAMRDTVVARRTRLDSLLPGVIDGATVAEAGAALAMAVTQHVADAGMRMVSVSVRADSARKVEFTPVGVRLDLVGDVQGLADLLQALEGGEMLLAVREISVSQSSPAASDTRVEELRVEMSVEALARITVAKRLGGVERSR